MPNELKPCPFCGGSAQVKSYSKCYGHGNFQEAAFCECTKCGARTKDIADYCGEADIKTEAKKEWNRRVNNA